MAIDPNIKNKAQKIRTEIYGKDVRESLASGLEAMSEDVVQNKNRQDTVEQQFQDVLDETTDKDFNSAPEIKAARGGHDNLSQRLLSTDQQLAQTEYDLQEEIQLISSDINENLSNIVKHRPIHVSDSPPTNDIGEDGDVYLETYKINEARFFENGNWVPVVKTEGSNNHGYATSTIGRYTKIGNIAFCEAVLRLSSKDPNVSGVVRISGLPFISKKGVSSPSSLTIGRLTNIILKNTLPSATGLSGVIQEGTNDIILYVYAPDTSAVELDASSLGNTFSITFSIYYEIEGSL